ncbi:unnamed protein product [Kluyveromyces dobzhanskii CBS 2104]|uniref:WGS project CCBQ000000000 data, contig 00006 n=1 Tax=Kluyveromyces dobzhanskii CBS 2104 TaxID=1427455 RepID=A0A0A8L813_9SACH|nr:unnamed protein product [Kluyveromyces dobzhanskii CBS 2104]
MLRIRTFSTLSRRLGQLPSLEAVRDKFKFSSEACTIQTLLEQKHEKVVLNGWIDVKPNKVGKNLIFGTLRDPNGEKIQMVDSKSLLKDSQVEDVVQIVGELTKKKHSTSSDPSTEYEVKLIDLQRLNRADKKASQLQDFKTDEGSFPPEYRYLQLRLPKYQKNLKLRYEASKLIRSELDSMNFEEVETPLLFKSTPEGAREFLVPTRGRIGGEASFYALPQSPQQYKQLLMASGIHRYFQIARCFRDEDLRSDRQPEFTQVDLEMAFASGKDVRQVVETVVRNTWNQKNSKKIDLHTLDLTGKIVPVSAEQKIINLTYEQVMTQYGIDKPDLRFPDLKIMDLSEFKAYGYTNKEFPVFEVVVLRKAFENIDEFKKDWSYLSNRENYNYRTPIVVPIETEEQESSWFTEFLSIAAFENPKLITKFLNLQKGDIIIGSTREPSRRLFENPTPLGRARQLITQSKRGKELFCRTDASVAAWVVDFPLFSPVEEAVEKGSVYPVYTQNKFCSTHHPFTMVSLKDYPKLQTDPLSCHGEHYDLVINGVELGGGSTRIHDPELQNYIFHEVLKIKKPEVLFGHLLNAFKMGTPPHAGFAIGFDRMCAMMCGSDSIRDVIAFPKSISGVDNVVGSPTTVPEATLKGYNIESK